MVKVLVIGASGYIGEAVSLELKRRGHQVFGLVRDIAKAQKLVGGEVQVVVGDITKPETYENIVKQVDVIVNAVFDMANTELEILSIKFLSSAVEKSGGRKRILFGSGAMVYEPSSEAITEESPTLSEEYLEKQGNDGLYKLLQNRIKFEKQVLQSKIWDAVILRGSMVYGRERGHFTTFFQQAEEKGKVAIFGDGKQYFGVVHIDDWVEGFARVVEAKGEIVNGQILHFAEPEKTSIEQIGVILAKAVRPSIDVEYIPWFHPLFANSSWFLDCSKAKRLLGWTTGHNLQREAKVYYQEWKALRIPGTF